VSASPDTWLEHAAGTLRRAGRHRGGARSAVIEALATERCAVSAKELEGALARGGRDVGTASIYRALEQLESLGLVSRVEVGDGVARYEPRRPDGHHHHHLVCDSCGAVEPFEDPALERAIDRLSGQVDFRVDEHEVLLHGACERCSGDQ
jgi:Fur family ferric uptake transcriptional regulator